MGKFSAKDYILLISIGIIWGSQFVFNELALISIPPLTIAATRILIGAMTLSVMLLLFPKLRGKNAEPIQHPWGMYCLISLFECVLPFFLVPWGQQHVNSSISAILMSTVPFFTLLIGSFFGGERWNVPLFLSVLFGFIGIVILVGPDLRGDWLGNTIGEAAIVLGAIGFAISIILLKKLPNSIPSTVAIRNIMLVSFVPMALLSLFFDQPWKLTLTLNSVVGVSMLGVFMAGIVYLLLMVLIKRTGPSFASLSNYLVPVVGVFIGILFMGEKLRLNMVFALLFVLLGLLVARLKPQDRLADPRK